MPEPREPYSARTVVRAVAGAVLLVSLVVGGLLAVTVTQFVSARDEVADELNPARVELGTLLALYVDQETAERGYILTGRDEFLEPFTAAGPQIDSTVSQLSTQVSPELWAKVTAMDHAHRAWLAQAAGPELSAARGGDRRRAEQLVASGDGKRLFDDVRTAHRAADDAIAAAQVDANDRADALLRRLSFLLAFTIVAFVATVLLGAAAFSRTVLQPLAELGRSSRAVAGGELQHAVRAARPREVAEVAEDVDTMRRHLLDELDASRRLSEALVLGQPAVRALQSALSELAPVRAGVEVAAQIESAEGVLAGDFLDIVELDSDRVALVLGDVSGHGHESAVVGLRLKSALSTMLRQAPVPDVLAAVRDGLVDSELFATMFVAVVDTSADRLSYVNAGHPPPLLLTDDGLAELEPTGPIVSGVLDDATWEVRSREFARGDALVVFSDGLIEARDAGGTEFGQDSVESVLADTAGRPPAEVVTRLRSAVRDHAVAQHDDVTVLVVRRVA